MRRDTETALTRFFRRYSPAAQERFMYLRNGVVHFVVLVFQTIRSLFLYAFHTLLTWGRTAVVVVAAHMIRAARGEKLVAQGKISSKYFKHLHDHKKQVSPDGIPQGSVTPHMPQRIQIHVETDSGVSPESNVE